MYVYMVPLRVFNCTGTVYQVLNACGKRMRGCELLPHAQSFYAH